MKVTVSEFITIIKLIVTLNINLNKPVGPTLQSNEMLHFFEATVVVVVISSVFCRTYCVIPHSRDVILLTVVEVES